VKRLIEVIDELISDWKRSPEILFVDDDEALVAIGVSLLTSLGCNVSGFVDSTAALDAYKTRVVQNPGSRPYDLVFLDLRMPQIDGVEFLRIIREIYPTQPVCLMTGYAGEYDWRLISSLGYVGLILKPFTGRGLDTVLVSHNLRAEGTNTQELSA
jgi:CheY-like chemotaxis protein